MHAKRVLFKQAVYRGLTIFAMAGFLAACAQPTPPAPTQAPAPTEAPAPTQAPTAAPAPTQAPVPTQAPAPTAVPPTQAPATVAPTAASTQAPAAGTAQSGGILRQAYGAPSNLDPAFAASISDDEIARQWGDFLVYTDEHLKPDPTRSLAEKWDTSADGLTWTFHLRQGVKFSNGQALTSKDVKAVFDRLRDKAVGAATVPLYANITGITTPDDNTVVFALKQPNVDLPFDLGDYHAIITWSGIKDHAKEFIGTGPFVIDTYTPEDRITFKRNPNYWMKDAAGNQLPYLDGLQFLFVSDPSAQVEALRGGQVDYLFYLSSEFVKTLQADKNIVVYQAPSNLAWVVRMRSDRKPFSDVRVRQAFKLAVDRSAILAAAYNGLGVSGRDTPFGPAYGDYYLDVPEPARDVAKAKQLLADAGYPNGLKVTLVAQQAGPVPAMATILQQQLADAGITVDIQNVTPDVYYGADNMWLNVDFAITDWGARAYPQPYLDLAYVTGAIWNESHWNDPELDTLSKQAASETDHAKRADLYKKIEQIFIDRGTIIVPFFANGLWAATSKLQGLKPGSYLGTAMDFRTVYFQK
jgi:peptide/nickel transport system substrate-binding protein